jgi:hypothetical protein
LVAIRAIRDGLLFGLDDILLPIAVLLVTAVVSISLTARSLLRRFDRV